VDVLLWIAALIIFILVPMPPHQAVWSGRLLVIVFIIMLIAHLLKVT
jgi:uncharacterized membrane protein